ncbi:Stk1 family PASTA domain-containing Ser/Thr kinase [Aneurinibacillus sp. UBA3580]|jgi:serine/threonine-protein kinase|uniref:Stk1 family PASTA domain-containing Ser/Thr kinase n=1 Tax=Aneurinibacillus sp. UBA3580 TaxID=1946041 RepID=UPI00257E4B24|nr:Stk1 family PASTA domain-containing Ser/Thr kinase [Aneurinibacillus sp. UBA3580]
MKGGSLQMIGKRIGGRYEIEQQIGEGGMAIVYRARDTLLNRTVALKVLRSQFGNDDDFVARFHREAQAAASLSHPNVVNIYDIGQEDDMYYIVMEYVEGMTLKKYINGHAPLDVKEAVDIAVQICDALDHAHQNELIHRDIKPHNILINKFGRIKVTDFGIARAVSSVTITHTGSVLGSVHYFSPEQAKGIAAGAKSDLYSLGVVLYEMLTGELPFSGDSPISVALKHLQETYVLPRKLRPEIPQSLENVIIRAMAKEPMYRYESAREMLEDLQTSLSPERRNEPVYLLPEKYGVEEDPEITRVIPAIKPEMMRKRNWDEEEAVPVKEPSEAAEKPAVREEAAVEETDTKPLPWKKAVGWVAGIFLFFMLVGAAVFYGFSFFRVPDVTVPSVQNMPLDEARQKLEALKLRPAIQEQYDEKVAPGRVIKQDPVPNMQVKENSEVRLIVSQGKPKTAMPNFVGQNIDDVESQLTGKYKDYHIEKETSEDQPAGTILRQTPTAGQEIVASDTEVTLVVSQGQEKATLPKLVGLTEEEAKLKLEQLGLRPQIDRKPSYEPEGTVIEQSYRPDNQLEKGTWVRITVSEGLPEEARRVKETVDVYLNPGEKANIEIKVTDATAQNKTVDSYTIKQSTQFQVPVVLSPSQDAIIQVYRDGQLYQEKQVKYSDFQ